MAADDTGDVTIQLKQCPRCRVAIRRNLRYGSIINQVLADIEQVWRSADGATVGHAVEIFTRCRLSFSHVHVCGIETSGCEKDRSREPLATIQPWGTKDSARNGKCKEEYFI